MNRRTIFVLLPALIGGTLLIASCDFSARSDLKSAEKAMKEADAVNAEFWDKPDYTKAQQAFDEAVMFERVRMVNDARDKARECKEWAQEAVTWAKIRAAEMQEEQNRVQSKKL